MFNNFQNLFHKHIKAIFFQKDLEEKIISLIKDKTNISLQQLQIQIRSKDKMIKIFNLPSSQKFFLKQQIKKFNLEEDIKNNFGFKVLI